MNNKLFLASLLLVSFNVHNVMADGCSCGTEETIINEDGSVTIHQYGIGWNNTPWSYQTVCTPNPDGTATCVDEWDNYRTCESMEECAGLPDQAEQTALAEILGFTPDSTWQYGYKSQAASPENEETGNSESGDTQISSSTGNVKKGKRIYTLEEATRLSKPTGNIIKIRYK
ncbi:MAG: hypothetical protein J5896_06165 [Alphaproteobacteria bacterium]|nr:hypothetical protein [Alphaproteobacteria bacterium]